MHHLSQQDIEPKVRRPHQIRWKRELALALQSPGLPEPQRRLLQERLANVGKPKTYRATDPPPPGALDPGPIKKAPLPDTFDFDLDRESLSQVPLSKLRKYVELHQIGLDPASTKAQVIHAIIDQTKENEA